MATDHYPTRSIDELAEIRAHVSGVIASLPLDSDLIGRLGSVLNDVDESVTAKRQAADTSDLPKPHMLM
jgi:hypothetical protein